MAEAVAAIGLVASIVQLVDFSAKVVKRLNELDSVGKALPNAFKDLQTKIELLDGNLNRIRDRYGSQGLDANRQRDVEGVMQQCSYQIQRAHAILDKVRPVNGNLGFRQRMRFALSVRQENDVREITRIITEHTQHLQLYVALSSSPVLPTRPSPSRSNSFKSLPKKKNESFAGRQAQIEQLDNLFEAGSRAALYGLGGVGKSQIAIEYGYRFLEKNPGGIVLWIYANTIARIDEAYKDIAGKAGLVGADDPSVSKYELVSNWLREEATDSWLMIVDNADTKEVLLQPIDTVSGFQNEKTLDDFIPDGRKGKTLVTSRDREIATAFSHRTRIVEVPNFTKDEGRQMLETTIGKDKVESETEVKELLESLEYLPLAISQAAAYIRQNDITVTEYLSFLKSSHARMMGAVISSWQLSFDYLRARMPNAAELLSLMSMLDCKSIPKSLICSTSQDEIDFSEAMGALKAYSLVIEDRAEQKYTAHRLIHLTTRAWVEKQGESEHWHKTALEAVARVFPTGKIDDWRTCSELEPHVEAVLANDNNNTSLSALKVELLLHSAQDRYNQHDSEKSLHRATTALQISKNLCNDPDGDVTMAQAYRMLGWCYFAKKDWASAISAAKDALRIYKKHRGDDHPDTMRARSNLSKFVMKNGDLEAAYEIQVEVLEAQQRKLGKHHEDVLYTLSRLVNSLRKLKRYPEALKRLDELVIARRASGNNPRATLEALFKHGCLLCDLRKYEDALPKLQEVCDGYTRLIMDGRVKDGSADVQEAYEVLEQCKKDIEVEKLIAATVTTSDSLPTRVKSHDQPPSRDVTWNTRSTPSDVQPLNPNLLLRRGTS